MRHSNNDTYVEQLRVVITNGEMQGNPCDIYFGYLTTSKSIFIEFIPIVIEVMDKLFDNMDVILDIYPKKISNISAEKLNLYSILEILIDYDFKYQNNNLCVKSTGIAKEFMHCFYNFDNCEYFENDIYGFSSKKADNENIKELIKHNKFDILLSYNDDHVGLHIKTNKISTEYIINVIQSICDKNNKELLFEAH